MNRRLPMTPAIAIVSITSATALGAPGDLVPIYPVTGDHEAVGLAASFNQGNALLLVGFNDVSEPTKPTSNTMAIQFYNAAGLSVGASVTIAPSQLTEIVDAGTPGLIETGDIWLIDAIFAIQNGPVGAYSFDVLFRDPDGEDDSLMFDPDGFPGQGDDTDEFNTFFQINQIRPSLAEALLHDSDGDGQSDTVFLAFDFHGLGPAGDGANSLKFADNAGINNPGDTDESTIDHLDFEFSTDGGKTFAPFASEDLAGVSRISAGDTLLRLTIGDPATANLHEGVMVRVNQVTGDVYDGTGNRAQGAVVLEPFLPVAAVGAQWAATVPAGGGPVEDALMVELSSPLSDSGDVVFWNALETSTGGATDLFITEARIDPDDPTLAALAVQSGGADGVDANGEGTGGAQGFSFRLALSADVGSPPVDIFTVPYEGSQLVLIGDQNCLSLNDDEIVDAEDLSILLSAWGDVESGVSADLDGDGAVDGADLAILLANWGPCP